MNLPEIKPPRPASIKPGQVHLVDLMINLFLKSTVLMSLTLASAYTFAEIDCENILTYPQSEAVRKIVIADAFQQWLLWEQKANNAVFKQPANATELPLAFVDRKEVLLDAIVDPSQLLTGLFNSVDGKILWPQHPTNSSRHSVPFAKEKPIRFLPVYFTASRSLALGGQYRGFTIKLPTDYPHGRANERQYTKTETREDVRVALLRTDHIDYVDMLLGFDEKLIILKDIMTISEKSTGTGGIIRDVRRLDDGHYYLPAFSIPFVGRDIAQLNNTSFEEFFAIHYAALLGEIKARLLLRTGLQLETPNPQNILIQFDRNLKPTGRLVFRDLTDAYLVDVVAKGLGFLKQIYWETKANYPPRSMIRPNWWNSVFHMNSGSANVSTETQNKWGHSHNFAFESYIVEELQVPMTAYPLVKGSEETFAADEMPRMYKFLASPYGQHKLTDYIKRMQEERQSYLLSKFRNPNRTHKIKK